MKNIFLEKLYENCGRQTSPRNFFPKNQIESTVRNFMPFAFIVFKRRELPKMH